MNELSRSHQILAIHGFACLMALVGCNNVDQIRRYTVERPLAKDRMLGAIIPQTEQAWFFKMSGPNEALDQLADRFSEFIRTVRFSDGEPTWQLPEGWVRTSGSRMRFATIQIDTSEEPLELSVTVLPKMADEPQMLLDNINRWRGQLQLPAITQDRLPEESEQIQIDPEGGLTATLVNMAGTLSTSGMGSAPFASGGATGAGPLAGPARTAAPRKAIEYETPEGWQPGQLVVSRGGIRIARDAALEVVDGNARAEITVTQLPASPQALQQNIRRWQGQVQLDPGTELPELKEVEMGGIQGASMELIGPQQAILGVIAIEQGTAWFVKLIGDHDLALRERERFQQFVESIQFKEKERQ